MAPSSPSSQGGGHAPGGLFHRLLSLLLAVLRPVAHLFSIAHKARRRPDEPHRRGDPEQTSPTATTSNAAAAMDGQRHATARQENAPLDVQFARLQIAEGGAAQPKQARAASRPLSDSAKKEEDAAKAAERAIHQGFMNQALDMARLALRTNETPVGCVLVHDGRVIAKGMNATNITRNGTRHAELMALCALLSYTPQSDMEKPDDPARDGSGQLWGDVDPKDGHLFPYGQKLHPAPRVDRSIVKECILYVTVEPCVMCASMLRQYGIQKVYFGAVNDKFGGTGGVFYIHVNSDSVSAPPSPALRPSKARILRPTLSRKPASCNGSANNPEPSSTAGSIKSVASTSSSIAPGGKGAGEEADLFHKGDGGNIEPGYEVEGGWGRDEAVTLLRQFYVQENGRAPIPRKKEGRAARLAAMMEKDGVSVESVPNTASPLADTPAQEGRRSQEEEESPAVDANDSDNNLISTTAATNDTKP